MKYMVLIPDGATDRVDASGKEEKTPLAAARTPNLDWLIRKSRAGAVQTIPPGMSPGSDVANLCILGYDPNKYYTGRAPLEATSMGLNLGPNDVAYRCNLVRLTTVDGKKVMEDFSAGHISSSQSKPLIEQINRTIHKERGENFSFYPGVSYRHLMVWKSGEDQMQCTPPHDIIGQPIDNYIPQGPGSEILIGLEDRARQILKSNPNHTQANSIWLWGQGKKPDFPPFGGKFNLSGSVISAVDLVKGIGLSLGLKSIDVPGATGYLDTNYTGKAEYALESLKKRDFVYVHVEAPDEAGHNGDRAAKIQALEDFDGKVLGTILKNKAELGDFKLLILPDHATPIILRTHVSDPVPFMIYSSSDEVESGIEKFDESILQRGELINLKEGYRLMNLFLGDSL